MKLAIFAGLAALANTAQHEVSTLIESVEEGGHKLLLVTGPNAEGEILTALHLGEGELEALWKSAGTALGKIDAELSETLRSAEAYITRLEGRISDLELAALSTSTAATAPTASTGTDSSTAATVTGDGSGEALPELDGASAERTIPADASSTGSAEPASSAAALAPEGTAEATGAASVATAE